MEFNTMSKDSQSISCCYICDEIITNDSTGINLLEGRTQHSNTSFPEKIEQVLGGNFMVVVEDKDSMCKRCSTLLDLFDRLQCDLKKIQTELKGFLNSKYHLDDSNNTQDVSLLDSEEMEISDDQKDEEVVSEDDSYECKFCKFKTRTKLMLSDHLKLHTKTVNFKCLICHMTFKSRDDILKHINFLHPSIFSANKLGLNFEPDKIHRTFKCGLCLSIYRTRIELINHFKSHKNSDPEDINSSSLTNESRNSPTPRNRNENGLEYENILNESTTTLIKIESEDVGLAHESTQPESSQEYQNEKCEDLLDSERSELCNNDIVSLQQLPVQGKTTVNSPIPHEEIKCDKVVLNKVHSVLNENEVASMLEADLAQFLPRTKRQIRSYVKIKMKPVIKSSENKPNDRMFMCSHCQLRSPSEERMKRHVKGHIALSNKTFSCHICGKMLTTRSNLKRHTSNHVSNPVKCEICSEQLTDRLHLKQHLEAVHPQTYNCTICSASFISKQFFKNHELIHQDVSHFKCTISQCYETFVSEVELKNHQLVKHRLMHESIGTKMFKCYKCHKILTTYHNLKRHLFNHEKYSGNVQCTLCIKEFPDNVHLKQHLEETHPESYQCGFCTKVFLNRKSCKIHELTHPERLFFKCEDCVKEFPNERSLQRHVRVAHRDPMCRFCGKKIDNIKKLIDHERRHERFKQNYPCTECGKVFRTPSGLRFHASVHTGQYSVRCDVCNKGFNSKVQLAEHRATHTKEKRYTCDRCGRTFTSNSTYRLHRLWHDNPFPYSCNLCNLKFRHTSILSVHKRRVHTGERPYKCPHCTFTFNISSTYNKHLILHTKEYPNVCSVCSKGFTTRTKIAKHMEKVHDDPTMVNEKRKPCEYKMVLRPDEYPENKSCDNDDEVEENPVPGNDEENAEQVQHINVIKINPGHPLYDMF